MSTLDLLRIVNTGNKPLILRHDGKGDVTIDVGRHRILPAEYAYISFGDPHAINQGKDKARDGEFKNARTLWGFYSGLYPEAAWAGIGITVDGDEVGPFKPQFECYDMEDQRVYLVVEDPDGTLAATLTGVPSSDQSDRIEHDALAAQVASQAAQIAELRNLVLMQQQTGIALPVPPGLVDDLPEDPEDDDEDEDDEEDDTPPMPPEETVEPSVEMLDTPPQTTKKAAAKKAAATKKAAAKVGQSQAARNEARDLIPKPPVDEPPVAADNPGTTRVGGR